MVNYKNLYLQYKLKYINAKNKLKQKGGAAINMIIVDDFKDFIINKNRIGKWFVEKYPQGVIDEDGNHKIEMKDLYQKIFDTWFSYNMQEFYKNNIDKFLYEPISNIGKKLDDFVNQPIEIREKYYRDFIIEKMKHIINFNRPILLLKFQNLSSGWITDSNISSTENIMMHQEDEWTHVNEI